jgi:hypothetical protein
VLSPLSALTAALLAVHERLHVSKAVAVYYRVEVCEADYCVKRQFMYLF